MTDVRTKMRQRNIRYPGIWRFQYLTIPARSDVFICHTHDTHVYPGMEYPGGIPGVCRVLYLTHGFDFSVPCHTGSIRYFQMTYLRYQRYPGILGPYHTSSITYVQMQNPRPLRVPRYGIPRVFTGITRDIPTRCTTHGAAVGPNSTQLFCAVWCSVTVVANIYDHRLWCRGWGWSWVCSGI